jgi:hypothetical protein
MGAEHQSEIESVRHRTIAATISRLVPKGCASFWPVNVLDTLGGMGLIISQKASGVKSQYLTFLEAVARLRNVEAITN